MGCLNQDCRAASLFKGLRDFGMYRMDWIGRRVVFVFALATVAALGAACVMGAGSDVPEMERRAAALNKSLMCPVCPGESIDQSQNALAVQMRAIVDEKLALGWSEREIKDFFVERYGPSVLMEPPSEGFSVAAWIVPPLAFALALGSLFLTLRWMRRISERSEEGEDMEVDAEHTRYVRRLEAATGADAVSEDETEREGSR